MPFRDLRWYRFTACDLPKCAGVYCVTDINRLVLYVGRTDDLGRRMAEHRANWGHLMHGYSPHFVAIEVITTENERG